MVGGAVTPGSFFLNPNVQLLAMRFEMRHGNTVLSSAGGQVSAQVGEKDMLQFYATNHGFKVGDVVYVTCFASTDDTINKKVNSLAGLTVRAPINSNYFHVSPDINVGMFGFTITRDNGLPIPPTVLTGQYAEVGISSKLRFNAPGHGFNDGDTVVTAAFSSIDIILNGQVNAPLTVYAATKDAFYVTTNAAVPELGLLDVSTFGFKVITPTNTIIGDFASIGPGNLMQIESLTPHGLAVGTKVIFTGFTCTNTSINTSMNNTAGMPVAAVVSPTAFTVNVSVYSMGPTVYPLKSIVSGIKAQVSSFGTCEFITPTPHYLNVGDTVFLQNFNSLDADLNAFVGNTLGVPVDEITGPNTFTFDPENTYIEDVAGAAGTQLAMFIKQYGNTIVYRNTGTAIKNPVAQVGAAGSLQFNVPAHGINAGDTITIKG